MTRNFEEIRKQARLEWEAQERSEKPRILVGAATCGRAAGAQSVLGAIKNDVARRSIDVDIIQVGCIGLCYAEPLVDIIKPNRPRICYSNVTPEIIPQIIEDYIIKWNNKYDWLDLWGIDSPGLTASLSIAEHVKSMIIKI